MTLPIEYIFLERITITVCLMIAFTISILEYMDTVHLLGFPISVDLS